MTVERVIDLLVGLINPDNAEEENQALEEAVKVLKQYNRLVQVKVRPVKNHIKIQYEGEELTIKELVDKVDRDDWKELAEAQYERILELKKQLADVQPVRHGRWKLVGADSRGRGGTWICTDCNTCQPYVSDYCPHCGAKMDDKDINVPTKSGMEEEDDG